ncbi:signal recognition particle, SRP9/SRP14 subunit [Terfezia boudieri ATCC MYA-4762]|uniref:Signal recognition particle subunit SRP14 n=1 Tax=Terfezia boudieri ATCC MYA-4762 TaxID=1051890 RepID=A0A3N4LEZ9_9PEZI|nr:signal recognition particle, SRP9/SRP14 subunit [Terfezia boudieri ATCC MYA-4762]
MHQQLLSNEEFFQKLGLLFATTTKQELGSVFLTQKRLTPYDQNPEKSDTKPQEDTLADLALAETPGPVLVRATNGASKQNRDTKKIKFSTLIEPDAVDAFYVRYAEVCKSGMTALKKKNRRRKNKKKASKATKTEGASA